MFGYKRHVPDLSPPNYPDIRLSTLSGFVWPEGKSCGVTIGWHVDGEAGPIGWDRGAVEHVTAMSEAAYGITTAMPRILALHRDLEIPATFFVPAHVAERHPAMIDAILAGGHEIAHHGYMHENLFGMAAEDQRAVFARATEVLERLTGRAPRGWSAPGWGVDARTLEMMAELGFAYDASLMEYDVPHLVETAKGPLIELPTSLVLDDWALFGGSLYPTGSAVTAPAEDARRIWLEEFVGLRRFGGLFHTTFHPNLMGRPGRLVMLEQLFTEMRAYDDVWWSTCEVAADHASTFAVGGRL